MQVIKNHCFIDRCKDGKIKIVVFDDQYHLVQYKVLDFDSSILNNIYCGEVEKVDCSIESCFVRISDQVSGFLPFKQCGNEYFNKTSNKLIKPFKKKDKVLVQIIRDSLHNKMVKVSNDISFLGQFCVYMPFNSDEHGISSAIKGDQRVLFKGFLKELKIKGSVVVRSSAVDINLKDFKKDLNEVKRQVRHVIKKFNNAKDIGLLLSYNDLLCSLRSYSKSVIDVIYVKSSNLYKELSDYKKLDLIQLPELVYGAEFEFLPELDRQVSNLYNRTIYLPSKGHIVIEKTEAMVTIDVNSGASKQRKNMEETAFKTNIEAANEIIDQIILRNLGGIIAIDFIDLKDEEHIVHINQLIKSRFKHDLSSVKIVPMNILGVVQISRERRGLSLFDKHYNICNECHQGWVVSVEFLVRQLFAELSEYPNDAKIVLHLNQALFNELQKKKYQKSLEVYSNLSYKTVKTETFKCILDN